MYTTIPMNDERKIILFPNEPSIIHTVLLFLDLKTSTSKRVSNFLSVCIFSVCTRTRTFLFKFDRGIDKTKNETKKKGEGRKIIIDETSFDRE